jgi:hypothetical protein
MTTIKLSNHNYNKNTNNFETQLENLQNQLPSILADFKKYYVFYNKNPEYNEYQQLFENIKNNLNSINSELFSLGNDVQVSINNLSKNMITINNSIQKDKSINTKLKKKLNIVVNKDDSTYELINEYNTMYNVEYLKNWAMLINIIVAFYMTYYIFKIKSM